MCYKIPYESEEKACLMLSVLQGPKSGRRATRLQKECRPYRCDCGAWHLTSLNGDDYTRIMEDNGILEVRSYYNPEKEVFEVIAEQDRPDDPKKLLELNPCGLMRCCIQTWEKYQAGELGENPQEEGTVIGCEYCPAEMVVRNGVWQWSI